MTSAEEWFNKWRHAYPEQTRPSDWRGFWAGWRAAIAEHDLTRVVPARHTDPSTSHAAAEMIKVRAGSQRHHMLIAYASTTDATDEEAMRLAPSVSPRSCYWKRCSELREAGLIEPTGKTRISEAGMARIVCRITPKGLQYL